MAAVLPLVIIGAGEQAEIACEYFTHDSDYEVAAFAVDERFRERDELLGLPVVPLHQLDERFPPASHHTYVAVSSTQLNRVRTRLFQDVKARGYTCASYVSSRAFVWHNVQIGENSFIFEDNVLQYHARVGDNVILWSGNHVGHRTTIADHCFVSSHVVISGFCTIGESAFMGVNSCVADGVKVAADTVVGAGAVVVRDTEPGKVYVGNPARPTPRGALEAFGVQDG